MGQGLTIHTPNESKVFEPLTNENPGVWLLHPDAFDDEPDLQVRNRIKHLILLRFKEENIISRLSMLITIYLSLEEYF